MTLIRSVNSVLKRTEERHLKEVILVDDYSDIINSNLKEEISKIDTFRKVVILRNSRREGLIRFEHLFIKILNMNNNLFM